MTERKPSLDDLDPRTLDSLTIYGEYFYLHCEVRDPEDWRQAMAALEEEYGPWLDAVYRRIVEWPSGLVRRYEEWCRGSERPREPAQPGSLCVARIEDIPGGGDMCETAGFLMDKVPELWILISNPGLIDDLESLADTVRRSFGPAARDRFLFRISDPKRLDALRHMVTRYVEARDRRAGEGAG